MGVTIHTEGVYKLDKSDKKVAWLTVEIPPRGGEGVVEVEGFQGIPCITEYEALENVSEMAISHILSKMNVTINDVNHVPFLETYRQLHNYMSWSMIL